LGLKYPKEMGKNNGEKLFEERRKEVRVPCKMFKEG